MTKAALRLGLYQATAIFSVLFALAGFSYNVWRMEVSEHNNSVREASFQLLLQLAELEQLVYAAHYDGDEIAGNPRIGWVKVGLIKDLSVACPQGVHRQAQALHTVWSARWSQMVDSRAATDEIVAAIDALRHEVRSVLVMLE